MKIVWVWQTRRVITPKHRNSLVLFKVQRHHKALGVRGEKDALEDDNLRCPRLDIRGLHQRALDAVLGQRARVIGTWRDALHRVPELLVPNIRDRDEFLHPSPRHDLRKCRHFCALGNNENESRS